jgi:hypothetical protein
MKLGILSTAIVTTDGLYRLKTISLTEAQELAQNYQRLDGLDSAVGHASTAEILARLLGVEIPVNRQQFEQKTEQVALVFKIKGRIPEGQILSEEQIESIGYDLKILERLQ